MSAPMRSHQLYPSAALPDCAGVSMPMMITRRMEQALRARGYTDETIRKLTPRDAWQLLGYVVVP